MINSPAIERQSVNPSTTVSTSISVYIRTECKNLISSSGQKDFAQLSITFVKKIHKTIFHETFENHKYEIRFIHSYYTYAKNRKFSLII